MLHFTLESRHVGGDSKFSHFFLSWTKFLCFFFLCLGNCGRVAARAFSFPRAFRARGCGERVTLLFGRAHLCGPADVDTTMSVWLLERSVHSEKQRTLLLGFAGGVIWAGARSDISKADL